MSVKINISGNLSSGIEGKEFKTLETEHPNMNIEPCSPSNLVCHDIKYHANILPYRFTRDMLNNKFEAVKDIQTGVRFEYYLTEIWHEDYDAIPIRLLLSETTCVGKCEADTINCQN